MYATEEINRSLAYLEKDNRRKFELRFIEDLFVFMLKAYSGPCGADVSSLLYYHPNGLVKESLALLSKLIG